MGGVGTARPHDAKSSGRPHPGRVPCSPGAAMASIPGVRPVLFVHPFDSFPGHRAINIADIAPDRSGLAGGGGLADWVLVDDARSV